MLHKPLWWQTQPGNVFLLLRQASQQLRESSVDHFSEPNPHQSLGPDLFDKLEISSWRPSFAHNSFQCVSRLNINLHKSKFGKWFFCSTALWNSADLNMPTNPLSQRSTAASNHVNVWCVPIVGEPKSIQTHWFLDSRFQGYQNPKIWTSRFDCSCSEAFHSIRKVWVHVRHDLTLQVRSKSFPLCKKYLMTSSK